ncbi:MAG: RsmD family RNA methyltransferase [Paenibacillaceae bacterium]|nr:RsmD family RNA methyltransferase [Paenibacillaceae bacterium]
MNEYLYTFACHEDERLLGGMERRALFGGDGLPAADRGRFVVSRRAIDASRSPFVKQRIAVIAEGDDPEQIAAQMERTVRLDGATFKIVYVPADEDAADYDERRRIERLIGARVVGRADMLRPGAVFGIARANGRWLFGPCKDNAAVWLRNSRKPRNYSTALGTRLARALVNIATPEPAGLRLVDPCCGMGTVLVEAMSMGIAIAGFDINPLAVRGARDNLAHFGMPQDAVAQGDMRELSGSYDAAIVDLPYNLCSVLSVGERMELLRAARRLARRAVIVSTEAIDADVATAGFAIRDRCTVSKGSFARQVIAAE